MSWCANLEFRGAQLTETLTDVSRSSIADLTTDTIGLQRQVLAASAQLQVRTPRGAC